MLIKTDLEAYYYIIQLCPLCGKNYIIFIIMNIDGLIIIDPVKPLVNEFKALKKKISSKLVD